jgi:hypothetical protein
MAISMTDVWYWLAALYPLTLTRRVGALGARRTAVLALPVFRAVAVVVLLGVETVRPVLTGVGVAMVVINLFNTKLRSTYLNLKKLRFIANLSSISL